MTDCYGVGLLRGARAGLRFVRAARRVLRGSCHRCLPDHDSCTLWRSPPVVFLPRPGSEVSLCTAHTLVYWLLPREVLKTTSLFQCVFDNLQATAPRFGVAKCIVKVVFSWPDLKVCEEQSFPVGHEQGLRRAQHPSRKCGTQRYLR